MKSYPVSEAAKIVGVSRQRIYQLIAKGRLRVIDRSGRTEVLASDVAKLRRARQRWTRQFARAGTGGPVPPETPVRDLLPPPLTNRQ